MRKAGLIAIVPVALVLGTVAAGVCLALGARVGLIVGEVLLPAPSEPSPSYICYGNPNLPRPLCRAVTPEQLQSVLAGAEVAE